MNEKKLYEALDAGLANASAGNYGMDEAEFQGYKSVGEAEFIQLIRMIRIGLYSTADANRMCNLLNNWLKDRK